MKEVEFRLSFGRVVRNVTLTQGVPQVVVNGPIKTSDGWHCERADLLLDNGVVTKVETLTGRDSAGPFRAMTISTCHRELLTAKLLADGSRGPLWVDGATQVSEGAVAAPLIERMVA